MQADTMVPLESQGVQAFDRFAYVNNNPVRYNDPTGHMCSDPEAPNQRCDGGKNKNYYGNHGTDKNPSIIKRPKLTRDVRSKGNSTNPEVPFDASLGGNNKEADISSQDSLPRDNNNDDGVNWNAAIVGVGLIITGGIIILAGAAATVAALSSLEVELVPLTAIITVGGGLIVYGGIRALINSGLIPGTERKR